MFEAIRFKQNRTTFFVTKLDFENLDKNSMISHFVSETEEGYQRREILSHVRDIVTYFTTNENPILPSAIIAAINQDDYKFTDGKIVFTNKMRIVDGQHRISGINTLKKSDPTKYRYVIENYEFPVIIMVVDECDSIEEIDTFINLNSKGKPVKPDLAEELKAKKYNILNTNTDELELSEELYKCISIEIVKKLNSEGFWKDLIIQADEIGSRKSQPISMLAYLKSIKPVVKNYLEMYYYKNDISKLSKDKLRVLERELLNHISDVWSCVIAKWSDCFNDGNYNPNYNICKGIGVTPIYKLYAELVSQDNNINIFKDILDDSPVKAEDWLVGGIFSGYASSKGFSLIQRYIRGEVTAEEFRIRK